ncbi:MAG: hypothetical protein FWE56_05540, partial [Candidatus Bathyarchaeota archaeon]|nr:hypothetical protein [Candidatus Termiticorpusculum sp.]
MVTVYYSIEEQSSMKDEAKQILKKLYKHDIINAHHLTKDTLKHCLPRNQRGQFNNLIKELRKQRYITEHPTNHGNCYAIPRG